MKLIRNAGDQFQFRLASREKDLLLQLLRLYPCIPSNYQSRKAGAPEDASRQLLAEALSESRTQNKKALEALVADPNRLGKQGDGWRLLLSSSEVDWLLQVLNDIRVGSWIELGSPESPLSVINAETAPHLWAMEMAGSFQMGFIELLES